MENKLYFSNEVIEKVKFYVYRLIDPRNGETFYVGKGKGNRVFNHINDAINHNQLDELSDKLKTIRAIHLEGLEVIHIIHRHGMDEPTALAVEAALIDVYPNATNIVGGSHSNEYGPMHASQIIKKYEAEEIDFKHKIIMININKSKLEKGVYSAVRCAWKINRIKAEEVEFVLAILNGVVIEVFKPLEWLTATKQNFFELEQDSFDRYGFHGVLASDNIRNQYIGKRVPDSYRKKGAANPVRYNFIVKKEDEARIQQQIRMTGEMSTVLEFMPQCSGCKYNKSADICGYYGKKPENYSTNSENCLSRESFEVD